MNFAKHTVLPRKKSLMTAAFVALSCACFLLATLPVAAHADTATPDAKKKASKTTTITISATGDCTLGVDSRYDSSFNSKYNANGPSYFFKNVRKVFAKDDLTIVNFEGTLTTSSARADKTFTFKGPSKYTKILTGSSVEVANLANNHTFDFGAKGFSDTKKALKKAGITYCYKQTNAYKTVKGTKVAFLGFNDLDGVSKSQIKKGIERAKKNGAKIIVVSFHWGIEKDYYPTSQQKSSGRYAIQCGASLVLGHHPHVPQGIEKYKGRYIVYSMGNFCFGGNTKPFDMDAYIFQQTFTIKDGKLLSKNDARVLPCSVSGKTYVNDYQPRIFTGANKNRLINKINRLSKNWHATIGKDGKVR